MSYHGVVGGKGYLLTEVFALTVGLGCLYTVGYKKKIASSDHLGAGHAPITGILFTKTHLSGSDDWRYTAADSSLSYPDICSIASSG